VIYYDLQIVIDPADQSVIGKVILNGIAQSDFTKLQVDLFQNLTLKRVIFNDQVVPSTRIANAILIDTPPTKAGTNFSMEISYGGKPLAAKNAPWDGGFVWKTDQNGNPWVGVACEGDGASLWWPNKDHLSDEPDSMMIRVAVPDSLICVANGELIQTVPSERKGYTRFDWKVTYPINNYNVTVNIGDYAHIKDTYTALDGEKLKLDYYVLSYNEAKATKHFKQVHGILACFEETFGKYPFWKDGFALVETPYLGMEHQGAIAYGNGFQRGYKGGMIPRDMNWDYILVHEMGHEYFGNSVSIGDMAEMWIHESFTTYSEAVYVECSNGYDDYIRYMNHFRNGNYIKNQQPIVGPLNVNWDDWGSSDHYFKGSWVLHTLRHLINDDALWYECLLELHESNKISIINTTDVIEFFNKKTGTKWNAFFEQYLYYIDIPILLYRVKKTDEGIEIHHRLRADVEGLEMPIRVQVGDEEVTLQVSSDERRVTPLIGTSSPDIRIMRELYLIDEHRAD